MCKQRPMYCMLFLTLALFSFLGIGQSQAGPITYQVTVDTPPPISGEYGYLDFQLIPGGIGAPLMSASVTNFSTDGILNPSDPANNDSNNTFGDWSGSLTNNSNSLVLNNDVYTEFFEGFTYGSTIGFDVTLSGPALNGSGLSPNVNYGSSFSFSLYASDMFTPLLTTDPSGSVLTINVNADSTTSVESFPQSPTDDAPVASVGPLQSSVPAPPSIVLFLVAVPAGLVYWRRSR